MSVRNAEIRLGDGRCVERATLQQRYRARWVDAAVLTPAFLMFAMSLLNHVGSLIEYDLATFMNQPRDPDMEVAPVLGPLGWVGLFVLLIYEPLMVALWGATVGKRMMGIRVVRLADGTRPGIIRSVVRVAVPNLAGVATLGLGWLVVWIVLDLSLTFDRGSRGWHDRLSGTAVVTKSAASALRSTPPAA